MRLKWSVTAILAANSRPIVSTTTRGTKGIERQTFSVPEAARVLGVHKETLYKAIKRGEIKAIRIGGRVVMSQAQLDAILVA
jgi:excisionase family DNA binding protein